VDPHPATAAPPPPANLVVWGALALAVAGAGSAPVLALYPLPSLALALALLGAGARGLLLAGTGLFIEGLLQRSGQGYLLRTRGRRVVLHVLWIGALLLCVAAVADLFLFGFAGYHLPMAVRILFADGVRGLGGVLEATGMSAGSLVRGSLALGGALGLAALMSGGSRRLAARLDRTVSRRTALLVAGAGLLLLLLEQLASPLVKDPERWEAELRSAPLAFAIVRPEPELASFRVQVREPPAAPLPPVPAADPRGLPDVLLVLVESLRRDAIDPRTTPRLLALADSPRARLLTAVTTGNVTHYAWYGLLAGQHPLVYDHRKRRQDHRGSPALLALGQAGYRIRVFASPDTTYQDLAPIVFGDPAPHVQLEPQPTAHRPEERDRAVVARLVDELTHGERGGQVFLVALDSSHFDYAWPADFVPPHPDYAHQIALFGRRARDPAELARLRARYLDAVAWVDHLLGLLADGLRAAGRLDTTLVLVTGDHGEAFGEHGVFTHGSDLGREQLEVPLLVRFPADALTDLGHLDPPGADPGRLVSHLDVLPTVLHLIGRWEELAGAFPGTPLQLPGPPRPLLTFQGWNSRAFRFVLLHDGRKALLELDTPDPFRASRLRVKKLTDLDDRPLPGPLELPRWIATACARLPFLGFP